ncbi:MAG: restriction endonuclease subunit S [Atopobiaceae bacterium]|nr:restriction endonuclease subunit S [Atopobiaceae bacterium]
MSRLNELIAELCPDGVEYRTLGEVGQFLRGSSFQKKHFTEAGVPCIHYGQVHTRFGVSTNHVVSYLDESFAARMKRAQHGDLIIATTSEDDEAVGKATAWMGDFDVVVSNDAFIYRHTLDPMYVSHFFASDQFQQAKMPFITGAKVRRLSGEDMSKIRIPVPPIEVQREIVRILDSFQELDDALTAEIEARKEILSACIDEMTVDAVPVENKADLIRMLERPITDGPHTTPQLVGEGIPFISAEAVSVGEGHIDFSHKRGFITRAFHEECCKKYKPKRNDVYMVKSGSTTGRVAMVETDEEFNIWSPLAAMRVNEANSARYLFYLLQSHDVQRQVGLHCSQGSQPNLGMRRLERFRVRIPTLSYQLNAVDSLDAIQTLIDSLRSERDARRKQFAYYRDKLLDLPEKVTTNG